MIYTEFMNDFRQWSASIRDYITNLTKDKHTHRDKATGMGASGHVCCTNNHELTYVNADCQHYQYSSHDIDRQ